MREFELVNDEPSPPLEIGEVVGFALGPRKGYLHSMHRSSSRYGAFDINGASNGGGWGPDEGFETISSGLEHINNYDERGSHARFFAFPSSKDLFRWLGSNQPI